MSKVVGLGAGGHSKVVIEILRHSPDIELVGLLDPKEELWGSTVAGVTVLGGDAMLSGIRERDVDSAFIGVGTVGHTGHRKKLYEQALQHGLSVIGAIHPTAVISPSARIGAGPTIAATAVIGPDAVIGDNVIVNTGAIVEHDCTIGNHVHIATGARLASTVRVGDGTHVGVGSSVKQCVSIGSDCVVGAGAAVVSDVPDGATVIGVPAREMVAP